mgnify:CR=1 FL=1|tara:strand:+ start:1557 stop:2405 length:849 start_codon:yes stop_codon:yes gene_type:complete
MGYLGSQPATNFETVKKDRYTSITGTGITLSHSVSSVQDIIVWVNSVKQDYTSYSVNGTALTLGGSLVSSDITEVAYISRTFQSVNPSDGSVGSSQVAASIITGQTALGATPADTDELLVSDAGTLKRVDYSYLKVNNTPFFNLYKTASQTVNDATTTKIDIDTALYDADGFLDSTNKRVLVPSGKGGTYLISYTVRADVATEQGNNFSAHLRLNGSTTVHIDYKYLDGGIEQMTFGGSLVLTLAAADYLEIRVMLDRSDTNTTNIGTGRSNTQISGFKLIT